MRHAVVTRAVLVLAVAFAVACLLFASFVGSAGAARTAGFGAAVTGAELFARRCTGCHVASELGSEGGAETAGRRADLLRFLAGHGHSEPAENERLADFLCGARPGR